MKNLKKPKMISFSYSLVVFTFIYLLVVVSYGKSNDGLGCEKSKGVPLSLALFRIQLKQTKKKIKNKKRFTYYVKPFTFI